MVLLDTNVASYIFSKNPKASYYIERIKGHSIIISFQTLEEMWFGALKDKWGERRQRELADYLQRYEIIWPDRRLAEECARLRSDQEQAGRRLELADAWIAATAILLDCPLASHDQGFSGIPNLYLIQDTSQ